MATVGVAEETCILGVVPSSAEEGFWVSVTWCCRPGAGALQATLQGGPRTLEEGLTWRVRAGIVAHTPLALARGSPVGSSKGQKLKNLILPPKSRGSRESFLTVFGNEKWNVLWPRSGVGHARVPQMAGGGRGRFVVACPQAGPSITSRL